MKKIFKILSILVIGFVMFSCSTPTNDPVEETPDPTHSIIFIAEDPTWDQPIADLLNSLPDYKNLKEDTEVYFPTVIYAVNEKEVTLDLTESSCYEVYLCYEGNITSVVVGNEDIEIKVGVAGSTQFK